MSAALATAALPHRPDPLPDPAAAPAPAPTLQSAPTPAPTPTRNGRLLGLLRKLIDYGKGLAYALQHPTVATAIFTVTLQFGTRDIALILARIARGLQLAAGLETRLVSHPVREERIPELFHTPPARPERLAQPATPRIRKAASPLALVPTPEEIAEAIRHRPVGAVIIDICHDLGIVPANPLWDEIMMVVTEFGGSYVTLIGGAADRASARFPELFELLAREEWPAEWPEVQAAFGTGPP